MKTYEALELQKFYKRVKEKALPLPLAYKFFQLMKAVDEHILFYREQFTLIINEVGQKDEEGKLKFSEDGINIPIKEGMEKEAVSRINDLDNLEVKIPPIKFTLEELNSLEMTIAEMGALIPLIEDTSKLKEELESN